jgi:hypothetical protein
MYVVGRIAKIKSTGTYRTTNPLLLTASASCPAAMPAALGLRNEVLIAILLHHFTRPRITREAVAFAAGYDLHAHLQGRQHHAGAVSQDALLQEPRTRAAMRTKCTRNKPKPLHAFPPDPSICARHDRDT